MGKGRGVKAGAVISFNMDMKIAFIK